MGVLVVRISSTAVRGMRVWVYVRTLVLGHAGSDYFVLLIFRNQEAPKRKLLREIYALYCLTLSPDLEYPKLMGVGDTCGDGCIGHMFSTITLRSLRTCHGHS